jgi:hypothetical protein
LLPVVICVAWNCSDNPASGRAPTVAELVGTWTVTQATQHQTATLRVIVLGDTIDSSGTKDTAYYYADSTNTYIFYSDSTYRMRGDWQNNLLPPADTGRWLLAGASLTFYSNSGDTTTGTASIGGSALSFSIVNIGSYILGAGILTYTVTTTFSGIKRH